MSLIVPVIGPTCAGKSSLLEAARKYNDGCHAPVFGLVEVGKALRAKHPPEFFRGQAAPKHTREEAWTLCDDRVREHIQNKIPIILIDGQPRDVDQLQRMIDEPWPGHPLYYIHLYASRYTRRARAWKARTDSLENLELALARIDGDAALYYDLLTIMAYTNIALTVYATDHPDFSFTAVLNHLIAYGTNGGTRPTSGNKA
jgi:hypothetical protein